MNNIDIATKIIKEIIYINIASITPDGLPWNTPEGGLLNLFEKS